MQKRVAIVDGIRTPFVKAFGEFTDLPAKALGRIATAELLQRMEIDPHLIDEVVLGTVATTSDAPNIARIVSLLSGIPHRKRAVTVSRNCASGLEAITSACEKILSGVDDIVLAGGTESMSNVPFSLQKKTQEFLMALDRCKTLPERLSLFLKDGKTLLLPPIAGLRQSLTDPVCGLSMGDTAEILAKEFAVSRKEQDEFACASHLKAAAAKDFFKGEIVAVHCGKNFSKILAEDNGIRPNQSMEALGKLKPYFDRQFGTVTAGNSSQITDGACSVLVASEEAVQRNGWKPLGYVAGYVYEGLDPRKMGLGPAYSIAQLLVHHRLRLQDIGLFEINEAFAAQVLACVRALDSESFCRKELNGAQPFGAIAQDRLNVNGGAIALGHPVGTSGARLALTLLREMKRRKAVFGVASLCIGGGQGGAILLSREGLQ